MRVNGASVAAVTKGKSVHVALRARRVHSVSLSVGTSNAGGSLVVILPGQGKMAIPLR